MPLRPKARMGWNLSMREVAVMDRFNVFRLTLRKSDLDALNSLSTRDTAPVKTPGRAGTNVAEKELAPKSTSTHLLSTSSDLRTIYHPDCPTMRSILPILSLSALLVPVQCLYFYIDGTSPKCFFEELPKDTLVVGHYTAEEYNENTKAWAKHDGLNVFISVDV